MKPNRKPDVTPHRLPGLTITVTKTADGKAEYLQVMSLDQFSVNVVLIADRITIEDRRTTETTDGK